MRRVFLDTVGLLALWNGRDQWHDRAAHVLSELTDGGCEFWTTTYIMLECGNAAARTPFRKDVVELNRDLSVDGKPVEPTEADCRFAWTAYGHKSAGQAGIVDEVSFAVMRRLGLTEAFTNDQHFRDAGFVILRH